MTRYFCNLGFHCGYDFYFGRGVFCGWLCPFGAMQELINEIARKFKSATIRAAFCGA